MAVVSSDDADGSIVHRTLPRPDGKNRALEGGALSVFNTESSLIACCVLFHPSPLPTPKSSYYFPPTFS